MNCDICNKKVERVDDSAVAVICSLCVSNGWDFSKLKKEPKQETSKEPLILIEGG